MWYNSARFGSPFDLGANYNLTVSNMTERGFSFGRFAPALFAYFLQAPSTIGVFPFIQAAPFDTTYMGQTVKEATFGGIFACLPLLWVLPFATPILKKRSEQRSTRTIWGVILVLIIVCMLVALLDAQLAGILQRYFADFSFVFLVAAVLLVFIVNENIERNTPTHNLLMKLLLILVCLSVGYSVLMCFAPETNWFSDVYPWAYQNIVEMVQFWT
jgi:drug/metabolite transporter superfamily protein YnfA